MHPSDEALAGCAVGDETDQTIAEHLRSCSRCSASVDELRDLIARVQDAEGVQLHQPPDALWARISAETDDRAEPDAPPASAERPPESGPRRFGRAWLLGGVAAGVAVGVLAATALPRFTQPQAQVVAQAILETLDTRQPQGQATVTGQGPSLDLDVKVRPQTAGSGFLEVWLINTDLKRMVSVGVLPNGSVGRQFPITATLLEQGYVIVDISREPYDDRPQHSGDSLLRGKLS